MSVLRKSLFRSVAFALAATLLFGVCACLASCKKSYFSKRQSVLLMGQSNMAGRGDLLAVDPIENEMIFMQREGDWVPMQEPIHQDKTNAGVGLAASFADAFVRTFHTEIGLVPCAMGGSAIADWKVDGTLYNQTLENARAALRDTDICAILWYQGSSDQSSPNGYAEKFRNIMQSLLDDLGLNNENVPILVGELGEFRPGAPESTEGIHAEFQKIGNYFEKYAVVSAKGLTAQDITTHFDAPSYRVLGYRYFAEYHRLLTDRPFTDFSNDPNDYVRTGYDPNAEATNTTPTPPDGMLYLETFGTYSVGYTYSGSGKVANVFNDANGKHASLHGTGNMPHIDVSAPIGIPQDDFVIEAQYRLSDVFTAGADLLKASAFADPDSTVKTSIPTVWLDEDGALYTGDKSVPLNDKLTNMEWLTVSVIFHIRNRTMDIYLDGNFSTTVGMKDYSAYTFSTVRLAQFKSNVGSDNYIYVDNFRCYYGSERID